MSIMPWQGCPMCGAPSKWMCNCPPSIAVPLSSAEQQVMRKAQLASTKPVSETAKFDPVAFWETYCLSNGFHPTIAGETALRALAAEAAKQQAIRDAEICRRYTVQAGYGGDGEFCAQAIEREANL